MYRIFIVEDDGTIAGVIRRHLIRLLTAARSGRRILVFYFITGLRPMQGKGTSDGTSCVLSQKMIK